MRSTFNRVVWKSSALLLALGLLYAPLLVAADATQANIPSDLQPLEEIPPPAITNEENADEPQITIIQKKGETIEEYRMNGQLYMIKVTPANGVPYYMHKEDQNGGWLMDGPTQPIGIPKWTIFRF